LAIVYKNRSLEIRKTNSLSYERGKKSRCNDTV